jgi:exopolyphosphatase
MTEVTDSSQPNQTAGNLTSFLLAQKSGYLQAVEQGEAQKNSWTISMGNEAGGLHCFFNFHTITPVVPDGRNLCFLDLDSLASAIAYAWYATRHLGQPTVPLLQTPRGDVPLRSENLYALEFSGSDSTSLLTGDELPPHGPPAMKYALLDHNTLAGQFAADDKAHVVAIVDHHVDEQHHLDASPRIVEVPTGSCSSLITRLIQKDWPEGMSRSIARLLLCAVLVDTRGLKPGGKAEAVDREVAPFLLEKAELLSTSAGEVVDVHDVKEVMELTQTLVIRKDSVDELSPRDLLRRDYKEYRVVPTWKAEEGDLLVGLAGVPRSVEMLTGGNEEGGREVGEACVAWIKERGLSVLGVLTSWTEEGKKDGKGKHRREMIWVVRDEKELKHRLWKGLEESKELKVERKKGRKYLEGMKEVGGKDLKIRMYQQGNSKATRKAIAPLIKAIFLAT